MSLLWYDLSVVLGSFFRKELNMGKDLKGRESNRTLTCFRKRVTGFKMRNIMINTKAL